MSPIRFSVAGLSHPHIFDMSAALVNAGAVLVSFYGAEPEAVARFSKQFPGARAAAGTEEILSDSTVRLVASAAVPNERAALGAAAMRAGKDFWSDKPGFTTLEQLQAARQVHAETGRYFSVYYADRLASPATVKAAELARGGEIGKVVQTIGLGPHRANPAARPDWFFRRDAYGGILADLGVHQVDQFLHFTGSDTAEVVAAQVANYKFPQYPELEDFGAVTLQAQAAVGFFRMDWYSPDGLPTWGDTRLLVLGTDGYLEVRKNVDLAGRPGGEHLFLADHAGVHYVDVAGVVPPFPRQLLADVEDRTETSMSQEYCFTVSEIALRAQAQAMRLGNLAR